MLRIPGFDHRTGRHCGTAALRSLAEFHGWGFDEATCLGLGGGVAAVTLERAGRDWHEFLGRPPWLETQFFESLGVPHVRREAAEFRSAWEAVTGRLDLDEPVLLFLNPAELSHVPALGHTPPHAALAVGYDEDAVLLSDATEPEPYELPLERLERAWGSGRVADLSHRHLVVTDGHVGVDFETAADRALRETTTYMLDGRTHERAMAAAGDHGPNAIHTLADRIGRWADRSDPTPPVRHARHAIVEHGHGAAFRRLYADALEELAPEAGVGGPVADRMRSIAEGWEAAADALADAARTDDEREREAALREAEGALNGVADRERRVFGDARNAL